MVEVIVTLGIFVMLASIMLTFVTSIVSLWKKGERRRVLYERAGGAMERLADDLSLAIGREPSGVDLVRVRFIGDLDPKGGGQRLMFVRSFEAGPERAITYAAGDGRLNQLRFRPLDPNRGAAGVDFAAASGSIDGDSYTGQVIGDFMPLGGMAQVAYFREKEVLYRAIRAPAEGPFTQLLVPGNATPLIEDCLYLAFDYWGQLSTTWQQTPRKSPVRGPEQIWDSTRGLDLAPLNQFILHRGAKSLNDPEDDVFPQKVKVTLTADSSMPRCTYTKLLEAVRAEDGMLYVDSTQGFPAGGTAQSYIYIEGEWIHYKDKKPGAFVADVRGARGTTRAAHPEEAVVRTGHTFTRILYVPSFREDWTPDQIYYQRLKNIEEAKKSP